MIEKLNFKPVWKIFKFKAGEKEPYRVEIFEGNLLLNLGIRNLEDLLTGNGVIPYDATSELGVSDDTTPATASQVTINPSAGGNVLWKGMDVDYPQRSAQVVAWRSTFGVAEANFAWECFAVRNSAHLLLNRKVEAKGIKPDTEEWILELDLTIA